MEIKNIHQHAEWFASYMNAPDGGSDAQGEALVKCQIKKIQQLNLLLDTIIGEIELTENPQEYSAEMVLESIKTLIENREEIEYTSGSYKWIG